MRLRRALLTLLPIAGALGCQQPARPIFPAIDPPLVWPKPPDTPRIRYIGQLVGEESLGAPRSAWDGLSSLIAGPKPSVRFSTPMSVAVRGDHVFVADPQNAAVFILDLAGRTIHAINRAAGEPLIWPIDIALSRDRLAVADSRRAGVFLFDPAGQYLTSFETGVLKRPAGVAWNAQTSQWWVADAGAHACVLFDRDGRHVQTLGGRGTGPGLFNFPSGLAITPAGRVLIADSMNFRVQLLDPDGGPLLSIGEKGDAAGDFAMPRSVAVDSDGHLYVLDNQFENVQVFDAAGRLLMALGHEGSGPGEFHLPSGITIDDRDRIWIADTYNRRVQVFQYIAPPPGDAETAR